MSAVLKVCNPMEVKTPLPQTNNPLPSASLEGIFKSRFNYRHSTAGKRTTNSKYNFDGSYYGKITWRKKDA